MDSSLKIDLAVGSAWAARWTAGATTLPELAEFFREFLTGCGPVVADTVAEFHGVAFQIQLILLEPGDVEFLPGGATFELAGYVFFVVTDDSGFPSAFDILGQGEPFSYFVMIPVVLTPSVLWVTRNLPCSLIGLYISSPSSAPYGSSS